MQTAWVTNRPRHRSHSPGATSKGLVLEIGGPTNRDICFIKNRLFRRPHRLGAIERISKCY